MGPRRFRADLALALALAVAGVAGAAQAADGGPRHHAQGAYDAASGVYTVAPGDDLGDIAQRFGVSVAALEQGNGLQSSVIQVGQTLNVPGVTPVAGTGAGTGGAAPASVAAPAPVSVPPAPSLPPDPWPRQVTVGDQTLEVYQPQVESWTGNQLSLRAAVAVKPSGKGDEAFGVVHLQAQTQVDKVQRQVVLENLKIVKAEFPTLPGQGATLATAAEQSFASAVHIVPLDRLEASLGANQAAPAGGVAVQNAPPRVIVSYKSAVLVPIQGAAVLKPVAGTQLQRVINTRAVILATGPAGPYYLHLLDGWVTAQSLSGPWTQALITPAGLDDVASNLAAAGQADLLNGSPNTPTLDLLSGGVPDVYVSETPAELLVFKGQPNLVPIDGTPLLWATNTAGDVIVDTSDSSYYVLMAGRWYRSPALLEGTWTYVAANALPAGFQKIPAHSPAGVVLASVAGTPQAREAIIANSIPQTATVRRQGGPSFKPKFDGPAMVAMLPGTNLQYVANSETAIIRVDGGTYYGLEAGVWFTAPSPDGPWVVAASVPDAIYAIPASSPLHYVTYVQVYGSTPEVVYDGYTPGYLGAVQSTDGVVVYGTGYAYEPWIGDTWIAAPETWGLAAQPVYNPAAGYAFGFGLGLTTAAMAEPYWGGAYYRPYYAGYGCCAATSANVYSHWGDTVAAGTRTWYAGPDGVGTAARGDYYNARTGTTGAYAAGRSYNAYTGTAQRGYGRTFDTPGGVSGGVERGERYNPSTRTLASGSRGTATGPGGSSVSRDTARVAGPGGQSAAVHQTTVDNARTGESHTVDTARVNGNLYAGADGRVYSNTGDGWKQHGASGWQTAGGDTSWADREQQARTQSTDRVSSFGDGGWGGGRGFDRSDSSGSGGGGLFERSGGDGFGGGFGGGGFGGGFGGGGFGGRFGGGGFRGRR